MSRKAWLLVTPYGKPGVSISRAMSAMRNYPCQILAAVTGRQLQVEELNGIGERIFNLNRAILMWDSWGGRKGDKLVDFLYEEPLEFIGSNRDCRYRARMAPQRPARALLLKREEFEKGKLNTINSAGGIFRVVFKPGHCS